MTDTTDTKALREAATKYAKSLEAHIRTPLDHDLVRAMDSACWELTDLIGNNELSIVINLLDQIEAERQRAGTRIAELEDRLRYTEETLIAANDLLTAAEARVKELEQHNEFRCWAVEETKDLALKWQARVKELEALKGDQVPIAWLNDAHLARGHIEGEAGEEDAGPGMIPVYRERFSAPQKPVVLPKSHYICGCADRYMSEKEVKAAIEAAGGIVSFSDERLMQDMSDVVKDGK